MANVKISQLPAVTVPLAGTEEVPVVQDGVTKRTAINNILSSNTISYIANGLGAVATPSYTFTGDLNTGMWSPAADTIAFSEGGVEAMRITSAGNVGIGTTSPGAKLDVAGAFTAGTNSAITHNFKQANDTQIGIYSDTASQVVVEAFQASNSANKYNISFNKYGGNSLFGGNVGIGVTSPPQLLAVGNATDQVGAGVSGAVTTAYFGSPSSGSGGIRRLAYDRGTGNFDFIGGSVASPSTQVTVTSTGNVGIGTSAPGSRLTVSGTVNFTGALTSGDLADAVGYKGLPQNAKTASYTLALSDMGKHISITTGGVVIPANVSVAFPIGSTIVIYNDSASAQNISITTDTLRLAGTATTGTRSLAQRGLATCVKVLAAEWVVSGNVT